MYICIRKCVYIYVYYMYREMCVYIEREKEKQCRQQILAAAMPLHHCTARDVRKSPRLRAPNPIVMSQTPEETNVKSCQTMATFSEAFGPWKFAGSRNISKFKNAEPFARYMSLRNFLSWHSLAIPLGWLWVSTGNVRCVAWGHPIWNLEIQSHRSYWHVVYCAYPIQNI